MHGRISKLTAPCGGTHADDMAKGSSQSRESVLTSRLFATSMLVFQELLDGSQANAFCLWEVEMYIDCSTTCTMHATNLDDRR